VIGVADPAFHGSFAGEAFDLWVPYMMQPELNGVDEWMLRDRGNRNMFGIARLQPGVTWIRREANSPPWQRAWLSPMPTPTRA
jgi:hypothetical protein